MSTFLGVGRSARSDEERSLRATLRLWCLSAIVFTTLSVGSVLLLLVEVVLMVERSALETVGGPQRGEEVVAK